MKKLILTGLTLLFAITFTFAQSGTPEEKAQKAVAELTEKLTLTEEQQTSVYPIILDKVTAKHAIKADETLSPEQLKEKIDALHVETNQKISALLTEEQNVIFAEIAKEKSKK